MKSLSIIAMTILACVTYGIIHDQITARLCVEYFTVFHPPVFPTQDPTLLGIGWGIIATWWVGLLLGIPLAIAARAGSRPKRNAKDLLGPIAKLMLVSGCVAFAAGVVGYLSATMGWVWMVEPWASKIPPEKHIWFLVDLWAHNASYAVGFVGGIALMRSVWRGRAIETRLTESNADSESRN